MARKGLLESNKKKLRLINTHRKKREEIKARLADQSLDITERMQLVFKLDKLPKNSSPVRYRNRCSLSGRPRGYYRDFGVSRIFLRELANYGELPGVTKSSW